MRVIRTVFVVIPRFVSGLRSPRDLTGYSFMDLKAQGTLFWGKQAASISFGATDACIFVTHVLLCMLYVTLHLVSYG